MENKRVAGIAAVMVCVFAWLCYKGYESYSDLGKSLKEISQKIDQVEGYSSDGGIPPTKKNREMVEQASKEIDQRVNVLGEAIKKYAVFCTVGQAGSADAKPSPYKPGVNPVTFQNRLKELSAAITREAADKCQLNNASADFGMTSLKNQAPREVDAPYLNFLASAIYRVEQHIISSGAPAIERIYCAALPEEKISARKQPDYFPLNFEVSFTARRSDLIKEGDASTYSVLPQVMNKIIHDGDFFFTITGMAVGTQSSLPMVSARAADGAASDDESGESVSNATLILGKDDEVVNVHFNIQVLYFTTDKLF